MTYEPLHHKYRPQTFAQLVGQEAIAATLTNAIRQQKIAPAYLFTGARGTGKTSSARILAKSLNCLESKVPTENPCGVCESCRAIARGVALDVIEIDAASNTGVDNIRELIERAQFAPVQCRYKVYIIDEVHMLSTAAFNALLKTLEEPPDRVVFVLATTDPQRVLPTIVSRCQKFDYRRIPLEAMVQHLRLIAAQENIPIADDAVTLVAQIAQGGLRDAESLLDQLSLLAGEITVEQVWDLVGSVPERDLLELVQAIAQDNPETVIDCNRRLMDRGREPLIVLQNLASFYRDLLIAKTAPDRNDLVAITPPTWQNLCELAQTLDIFTILAGQQHLRGAEVQLKHTTQPRLWLEVTLMGLLPSAIAHQPSVPTTAATPSSKSIANPQTFSPVAPPAPPAQSVSAKSAPAAVEPQERTAPSIQPAPVADGLQETWRQIVNHLHPLSKALLGDYGRLVSYDGQTARIGISGEKLLKIAQNQSKNIEQAFMSVFQQSVKISLEVLAPSETTNAAPTSTTPLDRPTYDASSPSEPAPRAEEGTKSDNGRDRDSIKPASEPFPTQPSAETTPPSWEVDEVTQAAQQLADFFAGKVVDLSDNPEPEVDGKELPKPIDSSMASWTGNSTPPGTEIDEDDDDVPF